MLSRYFSFTCSRVLRSLFAVAVLSLATAAQIAVDEVEQPLISTRAVRMWTPTTHPGEQAIVDIFLDSLGDETVVAFSLHFDPTKLRDPVVTMGDGNPPTTVLSTNLLQAHLGRIGILTDSKFAYAGGSRHMVRVAFTIPSNTPVGSTPVFFADSPARRALANISAMLLPSSWVDGAVPIVTPTTASISGRVLDPEGRGLRNAVVVLSFGEISRIVRTSSFGEYTFTDVPRGAVVLISANSKRYRFASRVVQALDNLSDINFTGLE